MTALCAWGIKNLNKRFWIGASGIGDAEGIKKLARDYGGKIQGEWLYDLTFLEVMGRVLEKNRNYPAN